MGSRDFESGSTNSITAATNYLAGLGAAHTHAALVTLESQPAGNAQLIHGLGAGGSESTLFAMEHTADTLSITEVATNVVPNPVITLTLATPNTIVVSKAAGTVAPYFSRYRMDTNEEVANAGGSTVAARTPAAGAYVIGSVAGANFYDGHIGAIGLWNRVLSIPEIRLLNQGRAAWLSLFGRGVVTNDSELFIDLTQPGTIRDMLNPHIAWTGGTQPAFGPQTVFRWPGW